MSTRQRKYRAWDPEDQCFAYFTLADVDERGCIRVPHGTMRLSFIDPELITEYIGRQDVDGRDIYEGDKVEFMLNGKKEVCPVEWNPVGMWSLRWSEGLNPGPLRGTYKVVGNIYEP